MWNPEEKKKEQEKLKRQAAQKIELPPLGGVGSGPADIVPVNQLAKPEDVWRHYLCESIIVRSAHGVQRIGKDAWSIVDKEKIEELTPQVRAWLERFLSEKKVNKS